MNKTHTLELNDTQLAIIIGSMEADREALLDRQVSCRDIDRMLAVLRRIGKPEYSVQSVGYVKGEGIFLSLEVLTTESEMWDEDSGLAGSLSDEGFFDTDISVGDIIAIQDSCGYNSIVRRVK